MRPTSLAPLLLLLSSAASLGQIEGDTARVFQIDEVVITGTRTERKIVDVPYAVERISAQEYKFDRRASARDVLESVPGLFVQSRYGNHDVRIAMRGFGSRSNSGIRGVRILLDGIPESEPDGQTRIEAIDFHSVGSIEIVRGNSSSLYPNAPGGVINFRSDLSIERSTAQLFSDAGTSGLSSSGFKVALRSGRSRFVTSYNYHSARGYRQHSEDWWHILNSAYETMPSDGSSLRLYGYYADGMIRLPGSITQRQFDADPFQPNSRDAARDALRLTRKGRIGVEYDALIGDGHEVSVTGYATLKYFERLARTYRIFNRSGIGATARYVLRTSFGSLANEFTAGTDLFYQSGPIEEYNNIGGTKGDILSTLTNEGTGNTGFYVLNTLYLVPDRLSLTLSGRYDDVFFASKNQILEVQNATRTFEAFTPKAALNWKITPSLAAFGSYGLGFDTPAGNELDNYPTSTNPNIVLNPDLQPQKSKNAELGVKGSLRSADASFLPALRFEAVLFQSVVDDEIVPFEVLGDVFFRNAARTTRRGAELGFHAEVLPGLRCRLAYTFSDFRYDAYTALALRTDTAGMLVAQEVDFGGNTLPSVPKHNLSASLSLERPLAAGLSGFGKVGCLLASGLYTDDRNGESTAGYELVNLTAGVDWVAGRYDVLLSGGVNNLFDRVYAGFININSTTAEFYEAGEPRSFFASLNIGYSF